jgi:hypothetical protein
MWEDYQAGMWATITGDERKKVQANAIEFISNTELFGEFMLRVVKTWKYSCEQNLSDVHMNRVAWIGQAACCLAFGCPEYITRSAWATVTQAVRDKADAKAEAAIKLWENQYVKI